MKATRTKLKYLTNFFGKIATAIVAGLPRGKVFFNPVNKSILQTRRENIKLDSEKHYHRPIAKPAVEKQTLLKEKKKAKVVH